MHELTLLERIAAAESPQISAAQQRRRLEKSLVRHLSSMLNTRRGSVPIAPDYGVADVTDLGRSFTEESIEEFKTELERVIMCYEPRLSAVQIEYIPRPDTPLAAVFEIKTTVNTEYGQEILQFETRLDATGSIQVAEGAR
jgi:type VI secretion system lysozyme-related protein